MISADMSHVKYSSAPLSLLLLNDDPEAELRLVTSSLFHIPNGFAYYPPVASFTKEVNPRLAKRPLNTNWCF